MDFKGQLNNIFTLSSKVAQAIDMRNKGVPNCSTYCPGEEHLISSLKDFLSILKEVEPECASSIEDNLIILKGPKCLNPYAFGGIWGVLNMLNAKYLFDNNRKRVFISHSSKDKPIIEEFVDGILLDGIGLNYSDIYCTSIEGLGIRNGDDMRNHIKAHISKCDYACIILSEHYKNSEICLNEMGAVWAVNKTVKIFTIPPVSYDSLGWLMEVKQVHSINNNSGLNELYDEMTECYGMHKNATQWDRHKKKFIQYVDDNIQSITSIKK